MKPVPATKLCRKCSRQLPFEAFYFKGLRWSSYCIECSRKERRDYYRSMKGDGYVMSLPHYTQQEVDFVANNYLTMTYRQLAAQLGRTEQAIANMVHKLGLRKNRKRKTV